MKDLIVREYNGAVVQERARDGYFNATAMCKAAGKLWNNYWQNATTKAFIQALSADTGIPASELIQSVKGGDPWMQGTWVHPQVAIHLAQWLEPMFAVRVTRWVLEEKLAPSISPDDIGGLLRRAADDYDRLLDLASSSDHAAREAHRQLQIEQSKTKALTDARQHDRDELHAANSALAECEKLLEDGARAVWGKWAGYRDRRLLSDNQQPDLMSKPEAENPSRQLRLINPKEEGKKS